MFSSSQEESSPIVPRVYRRTMIDHATFVQLTLSRDWLADHHSERITLNDAAARAAFSPFHYQRLFRRAFGESPLDFLTRIRLDRAKKILRTSSDPVTEICLELGYQSLGSFSSLFRRQVGLAPSEFRRVFSSPDLWALKATPACFRFGSEVREGMASR